MRRKIKVGDKFNKLTIIALHPKSRCTTECECGTIKENVYLSDVSTGRNKSCGRGLCAKRKILLGLRFGKLEVIGYTADKDKILVRCDCGNEVIKTMHEVTIKKRTVSCGKGLCSKTRKDLTGKQFGYLTAQTIAYKEGDKSETYWECLCICGNKRVTSSKRLMYGHVKSCGCLSIKLTADAQRKPNNERAIKSLFNKYKLHAFQRSLEFSLTYEEFSQFITKNCFYCKSEPKNTSKNRNNKRTGYIFNYNGIDRMDSSLGYVTNNCVTCCKHCNFAKRKLSVREFVSLARAIANNFKDVDISTL